MTQPANANTNSPKPLSPQTRKMAAILGVRIAKEGRGYKYHTPIGVFNSLTAAAEALQGNAPKTKNPAPPVTVCHGCNSYVPTNLIKKHGGVPQCPKCINKAKTSAARKAQRRFFDDQIGLFENPSHRPRKENFLPAALAALGAVRELRTPSRKNSESYSRATPVEVKHHYRAEPISDHVAARRSGQKDLWDGMDWKKNPGRLSKAARILDAAQTLRDALRRQPKDTTKAKKRNPETDAEAQAVAQVYEMFQGRQPKETKPALPAPDGTPSKLAQLGFLSYLKAKRNGVIRTWSFTDFNAPLLCADKDGNLHIVGNVITQEPAGDMGELVKIGYVTHKDHIGDAQEFDFRHRFGEQGGDPPHLHIDAEGFFRIVGGDYRLQAEGIVD